MTNKSDWLVKVIGGLFSQHISELIKKFISKD